jgi:CHAT domain-containing protein
LAKATLDSYRYRFSLAERSLLALRRESLGDAVARRAAFELARIKLAQGYPNAALPWIDATTREALAAGDTLTLVDVMLVRASVLVAQTAVFALLDSVVALGAEREPYFVIAPLCRRGGVLHGIGQHRQARVLLHDGAARARAAGLLRTEGRCRLALTVSFINTGETDSMRVQHFEVTRLATASGDLANLGSNVQWAATYLARLGRLGLARANLDSAITLGRLTNNDVIIAYAALGYADLDLMFSDAKGAYAWMMLSDSLMRARADGFGIAVMPGFRARLALLRNDYESVLRLSDSAVTQSARTGAAASYVAALGDRSHAALRLGRVADAIEAHDRRRDLTTRFQMRGYEPALLRDQAEIALWGGQYQRADSLFAAFGATLHATQYGLKHDVLMYRAHSKLLSGSVVAAEQLGRDAGNEYARWRASLTDPDDRRRAAQSNMAFGDPYGLPRFVAELVKRGRPHAALEFSEQRRAQSLRESLARNTGLAALPNDSTSIRQLQTYIPDRETALLAYVLGIGDAPTTLFVVTRDTVAAFALGATKTFAEQVRRLTSRLEARQDANDVARELGAALIQPAHALLARGISRLVIIPDGPLHFVPFDALVLSSGRFVIDDFETSTAPSFVMAAQWWRLERGKSSDLPSLVIGDPAYPRTSLRLPFGLSLPSLGEPARFERLPASGREARRVAGRLGNPELLLAAAASEDRLRRAAGREMRVLHIAAHAVADDWSPDRSFLALAPSTGHDGIVTRADLASLDLRAQLIVLSACRTARGEVIGGEGVQSLVQPFLERGSRAILATTWSVQDRHAASLIDRFYAAVSRGTAVGAALREAKLALRQSGVPASEWSAYTLLGDASLALTPSTTSR